MANYAELFLKEMEAEVPATRKCLERIPDPQSEWKPHEKSMALGSLALLVAEIPKWIAVMLKDYEIDYATFKHPKPANAKELVNYLDESTEAARKEFSAATEETFKKDFTLKYNGQVLLKTPIIDSISSTINHWVHHRGQLTVYMRLNDIAVPSIYGPSADDKNF